MKRLYNLLEGQDVRLTILGSEGWSGEARIIQVDTGTISIECANPMRAGVAVRLDADDVLLLGECRRCETAGPQFRVEMSLEQVIPSMSNLAKLITAICGATPRHTTVAQQEPVPTRR